MRSLLGCLVLVAGLSTAVAETWKLAGSDFLEEIFIPLRAEVPVAEGDTVEWAFPGSSPAMVELREGRVGLALAAFPSGQTPASDIYLTLPIGYQVAVVAVHSSNPLSEISLSQLRGVFGSQGGVTQWGGLGLRGAWESRAITAHVLDNTNHLGAEIFRTTTLGNEIWRSGIVMSASTDPIYLRLQEDPGVLAILPTPPPPGRGKILPVTADRPGYAFGPSMENVALGDYPLRLTFYAVIRRDDVTRWRPWLRWLASDTVADALAAKGFLAVPPATRRQRILELDLGR